MLGVLGGMGPLASAEFVRQVTLLTPARRDQDHIPLLLWSDPRVPDRIAAWRGTGESPVPALLRGVRAFEAAACEAIAMPCNTAHGWYDELQAATRLPILHIVDATAAELARQGVRPGPVGLMATTATLEMRLFEARLAPRGWSFLTPTRAEMEQAVKPAIAAVKRAELAAAAGPFAAVARALVERGASGVVLACTEMPLGLAAGPPLEFPVCDTLEALARAVVGWGAKADPGGSDR